LIADFLQMNEATMQNGTESDDSASLITGKALERYFELNDALREFSRLFQEEKNERAAAIVGGAFLDTLLEHILLGFLAEDEKEVQRLLDPEQPLGSYGSRIRIVYCLGLIGKVIRDDLRLVGKIRNRFAHDLHASFDDEPIRSWCLSLKWHELSMFMKAPEGATAGEIFQVGVNQLVTHLNGIVSIARMERRQIRREI
jgi:hypothetical protein